MNSLNLTEGQVLDSQAVILVGLLHKNGILIPPALLIYGGGLCSSYSQLACASDAELFFHAGFHDINTTCPSSLLWAENIPFSDSLSYLCWLLERGLDLSQGPASFSRAWARIILIKVGQAVRTLWHPPRFEDSVPPSQNLCANNLRPLHKTLIHKLNRSILPLEVHDDCQCSCLLGGGCIPFHSMLQYTIHKRPRVPLNHYQLSHGFCKYLEIFGSDLGSREIQTAIRYLTFETLD